MILLLEVQIPRSVKDILSDDFKTYLAIKRTSMPTKEGKVAYGFSKIDEEALAKFIRRVNENYLELSKLKYSGVKEAREVLDICYGAESYFEERFMENLRKATASHSKRLHDLLFKGRSNAEANSELSSENGIFIVELQIKDVGMFGGSRRFSVEIPEYLYKGNINERMVYVDAFVIEDPSAAQRALNSISDAVESRINADLSKYGLGGPGGLVADCRREDTSIKIFIKRRPREEATR